MRPKVKVLSHLKHGILYSTVHSALLSLCNRPATVTYENKAVRNMSTVRSMDCTVIYQHVNCSSIETSFQKTLNGQKTILKVVSSNNYIWSRSFTQSMTFHKKRTNRKMFGFPAVSFSLSYFFLFPLKDMHSCTPDESIKADGYVPNAWPTWIQLLYADNSELLSYTSSKCWQSSSGQIH